MYRYFKSSFRIKSNSLNPLFASKFYSEISQKFKRKNQSTLYKRDVHEHQYRSSQNQNKIGKGKHSIFFCFFYFFFSNVQHFYVSTAIKRIILSCSEHEQHEWWKKRKTLSKRKMHTILFWNHLRVIEWLFCRKNHDISKCIAN